MLGGGKSPAMESGRLGSKPLPAADLLGDLRQGTPFLSLGFFKCTENVNLCLLGWCGMMCVEQMR